MPRREGEQTDTQTRGSQETERCIGPLCSQHSIGTDAVCTETTFPLPWGTCTRNTSRTRVFLRPMSVSPFRSSMSEFRSFRIPAQSMLKAKSGWQAFPAEARVVMPLTHPRGKPHSLCKVLKTFSGSPGGLFYPRDGLCRVLPNPPKSSSRW